MQELSFAQRRQSLVQLNRPSHTHADETDRCGRHAGVACPQCEEARTVLHNRRCRGLQSVSAQLGRAEQIPSASAAKPSPGSAPCLTEFVGLSRAHPAPVSGSTPAAASPPTLVRPAAEAPSKRGATRFPLRRFHRLRALLLHRGGRLCPPLVELRQVLPVVVRRGDYRPRRGSSATHPSRPG